MSENVTGRDFGRLEGKVDQIMQMIEDRASYHDALEARVRKVETSQTYSSGKASVYGLLAGFVASFASVYFGKHI